MSLMSDALDWMYEVQHDANVCGETVTYHIGDASVTVLAVLEQAKVAPPALTGLTPGQYDLATPSAKNVDHDFSIMAADLQIDGVPILPAKGHFIRRTFGGSTKVYQLLQGGQNNKVWEWQDGYDKRYLIHTKLVSEE